MPDSDRGDASYGERIQKYLDHRNFKLAMEEVNGWIDRHAQSAVAVLWRGRIYEAQGETDAALTDYDEAIRRDNRLMDAYLTRGKLRLQLGLDGARQDFKRVATADPANKEAKRLLEQTRTTTRRVARAAVDQQMGSPVSDR